MAIVRTVPSVIWIGSCKPCSATPGWSQHERPHFSRSGQSSSRTDFRP
jgi:hypothetical protein